MMPVIIGPSGLKSVSAKPAAGKCVAEISPMPLKRAGREQGVEMLQQGGVVALPGRAVGRALGRDRGERDQAGVGPGSIAHGLVAAAPPQNTTACVAPQRCISSSCIAGSFEVDVRVRERDHGAGGFDRGWACAGNARTAATTRQASAGESRFMRTLALVSSGHEPAAEIPEAAAQAGGAGTPAGRAGPGAGARRPHHLRLAGRRLRQPARRQERRGTGARRAAPAGARGGGGDRLAGLQGDAGLRDAPRGAAVRHPDLQRRAAPDAAPALPGVRGPEQRRDAVAAAARAARHRALHQRLHQRAVRVARGPGLPALVRGHQELAAGAGVPDRPAGAGRPVRPAEPADPQPAARAEPRDDAQRRLHHREPAQRRADQEPGPDVPRDPPAARRRPGDLRPRDGQGAPHPLAHLPAGFARSAC